MCTLPPPSTISRCTPRSPRSSLIAAHLHRLAAVDHGRHRAEPRAGVGHPRARAVDELLGVAGGEEGGARVQLHPLGHGDLDRRRREPAGRPLLAAHLRAHEQPRVVVPHGRRADQDRVAGGAHGVDPVEVGVVGQRQAPRRRAAEVAVDRHAAAEQGVRAVRHLRLRPAAPRPGRATGAARRRRLGAGGDEPCHDEDGGARQAGDEHHDAVDDRGGDALLRHPGRPRRTTQAVAPSRGPQPATLGSTMASITSSASGSIRDGGAVRSGGARGDQEGDRVAGDDQRRGERDADPRPPREQPVADVAGHRAADARPPGRTATAARPRHEHDAERRHAEPRARPAAWTSLHGRRQHEQDGDGQDGLHDLPRGALPGDGPQPAADVADVAAVADAAVDVAHDAAGQRDVEEQRPVVRRHRRGQRQVDAETARHDLPAPGAAHGGQHREAASPPPAPRRRPCGCRRGTGPCRGARPGPRRPRRRPQGGPSATSSGSSRPRYARGRQRGCRPASGSGGRQRQHQQVGVVHGDREPLQLAACARRRRA